MLLMLLLTADLVKRRIRDPGSGRNRTDCLGQKASLEPTTRAGGTCRNDETLQFQTFLRTD